jgi:hypothetical protein
MQSAGKVGLLSMHGIRYSVRAGRPELLERADRWLGVRER